MKKIFLVIITIFCAVVANAQSDSLSTDETVLDSAEKPAEYPGGNEKIHMVLIKNVNYPPIAIENRTQGTVKVSFVVEKDGSISTIKLVEGIGDGCDEEVMRALSLLEKFKPAMKDGKPVRFKMTVPFKFKLV